MSCASQPGGYVGRQTGRIPPRSICPLRSESTSRRGRGRGGTYQRRGGERQGGLRRACVTDAWLTQLRNMHSPPSAQMQRNLSTRRLGRSVAIPTSQSRSFACLSAAAAMGTARSLSKKQMETGLVHDLAPLHRDAIHTAAATGAGLAGEEGAHTPTTDNESDSDFRAFGGGVQRPLTASESMPLLCAADGTLGVVGSGPKFCELPAPLSLSCCLLPLF